MTSQNLVAGSQYHLVDVNLVAEDDHVVAAAAVKNVKYSPVVGSDNIHDLEKAGVDATSVMVAFACAFGSVTMELPGLIAADLV